MSSLHCSYVPSSFDNICISEQRWTLYHHTCQKLVLWILIAILDQGPDSSCLRPINHIHRTLPWPLSVLQWAQAFVEPHYFQNYLLIPVLYFLLPLDHLNWGFLLDWLHWPLNSASFHLLMSMVVHNRMWMLLFEAWVVLHGSLDHMGE